MVHTLVCIFTSQENVFKTYVKNEHTVLCLFVFSPQRVNRKSYSIIFKISIWDGVYVIYNMPVDFLQRQEKRLK